MILAGMLPSTLVGLPGPGGYVLANYRLIPYAPVVPILAVAIGVATVWADKRLFKSRGLLVMMSSGFILTVAFSWIYYANPSTYVQGLGFPLSWILLLALPLRPVQVLGASVIAFLFDWMLWTLFVDSLSFAAERRKFRQKFLAGRTQ